MSGAKVVEDWKPTDAEVYASVRNAALEEAAKVTDDYIANMQRAIAGIPIARAVADVGMVIRALKSGAE